MVAAIRCLHQMHGGVWPSSSNAQSSTLSLVPVPHHDSTQVPKFDRKFKVSWRHLQGGQQAQGAPTTTGCVLTVGSHHDRYQACFCWRTCCYAWTFDNRCICNWHHARFGSGVCCLGNGHHHHPAQYRHFGHHCQCEQVQGCHACQPDQGLLSQPLIHFFGVETKAAPEARPLWFLGSRSALKLRKAKLCGASVQNCA